MINKLSEIAKGYGALVRSKLLLTSEEEEKLAKTRMDVCNACEFKSKVSTCNKCGCYLPAKTKNKDSKCPLLLW